MVKEIPPACIRNLDISFSGENFNELDFFLTEKGVPACSEYEAGEFRQDSNKYLLLRKQLHIPESQFVMCFFGPN